ncbi:unnamed protein product, partial [Urochloa humidicola]
RHHLHLRALVSGGGGTAPSPKDPGLCFLPCVCDVVDMSAGNSIFKHCTTQRALRSEPSEVRALQRYDSNEAYG